MLFFWSVNDKKTDEYFHIGLDSNVRLELLVELSQPHWESDLTAFKFEIRPFYNSSCFLDDSSCFRESIEDGFKLIIYPSCL